MPQAEAFLVWFRENYAKHHRGAHHSIGAGEIRDAYRLLADRTEDRVRAMTDTMWTITPAEDAWIARAKHRGLKLLVHAADRLDLISRERETPKAPAAREDEGRLHWREVDEAKRVRHAWGRCLHEPECEDWRACVRLIALSRRVS